MPFQNQLVPESRLFDLIRHPHAFPGGYEMFVIFQDGGCGHWRCVEKELSTILRCGYTRFADPQWCPLAIQIREDYEDDGESLTCDICGRPFDQHAYQE